MGIVVIQEIETVWTKSARGGKRAILRNAIPEAVKIPYNLTDIINIQRLYHSLRYNTNYKQRTQPTEDIRVSSTFHSITAGCVHVEGNNNLVLASFQYNIECGGAPNRKWLGKTLRIAPNEWGQMIYNGLFVYRGSHFWLCKKTVVNVGIFERITPGLFTRSAPTHRFSAMAEIW